MSSKSQNSYTTVSLWDKPVITELFSGIRLSTKFNGITESQRSGSDDNMEVAQPSNDLLVSAKRFCSVCQIKFESRHQQVLHFKTDWHCDNLKRKAQGLQPLLQENKLSSSSTEDDESEVEETEVPTTNKECSIPRLAKLYLENQNGNLLSFYKVVALKKKEIIHNEDEIVRRITQLANAGPWGIFLLGGGRLAAAIFKDGKILVHKTFNRYVTRAKQGTTQSVHDHHSGHANSAGASLRRQNELALTTDVMKLVQAWSSHLDECSHIFYHVAGRNKSILFGGRTPLFKKDDFRLRNIPFPTKRATLQEVVRAFNELSTVECYGSSVDCASLEIVANLKWQSEDKQNEKKGIKKNIEDMEKLPNKLQSNVVEKAGNKKTENISDTGKVVEMDKRIVKQRTGKIRQLTPQHSSSSSCNSDEDSVILEFHEEILETSPLSTFEISVKPAKGRFVDPRKEPKLRNSLYTACKMNDINTVIQLLLPLSENNCGAPLHRDSDISVCADERITPDIILHAINTPFGKKQKTLLHVSSEHGYAEILWLLLESGADPTTKDGTGSPAYVSAANKNIRDTFRRFMASFPEKYDYARAQIPSPLTIEEEKARAVKQQQKRQKLKARKIELEEKNTFLNLSDKEKIAVMKQNPAAVRCVGCATLLGSTTPFEYKDYKFCKIECLQKHRKLKNQPS